jgi:hypothetical protein
MDSMPENSSKWTPRVRPRSPTDVLKGIMSEEETWTDGKEERRAQQTSLPKRPKHVLRGRNLTADQHPTGVKQCGTSLADSREEQDQAEEKCDIANSGTENRRITRGSLKIQEHDLDSRENREQGVEVGELSNRQLSAPMDEDSNRLALQPMSVNSQSWKLESITNGIKVAARRLSVRATRDNCLDDQ